MPEAEWKWVCQRPERAFFISTSNCAGTSVSVKECVNALNGLSSFLQKSKGDDFSVVIMCQRPQRAFFIST